MKTPHARTRYGAPWLLVRHWVTAGLVLANLPVVFAVPAPEPSVISVSDAGVVLAECAGQRASVRPGEQLGRWRLMSVLTNRSPVLAVFEDLTDWRGPILFASTQGMEVRLPKSLEPTFADPASLYRGRRLQQVLDSDRDLLGEDILSQPRDPAFEEVAACFPPIAKMKACYTFVGTHDNWDKVGIFYGGSTSHFDPAAYVPGIQRIRETEKVLDGLVGGWLPAVRFVYPEREGDWSELIAFAPVRLELENPHVQPVWYRLSRMEGGSVKWVRYFDSYHPFPPRLEAAPDRFYADLLEMRSAWERLLAPAMKVSIPDERLWNMARHSLVRELMTRTGAWPKYGVFDRSYGGSEHDGFPDTFTADTTAMLAWGLFERAAEYIDNYFDHFVREDGSILYRGPETGQFGRMLTVVAQYADRTGDLARPLRHRKRLDGITHLLLSLREKALLLPASAPDHGLIAGWSEADACLDPDPPRYMQPYFSNSSEAARGFHDLGAVWQRIGRANHDGELTAWGQRLSEEAAALNRDVQAAIQRSMLRDGPSVCLPAIAGAREPFHVAVARDKLDPQFRSYRAYMEMLYSGNLTPEQVETIVKYRAAHRDTILGIPACYGYNTHELAGFLSYGHAYGLLQHDHVREYLLTLWSLMAHQYTRGTWTAPETRNIDPKWPAAPYCTPAQLVVPLLVRWMLVFEEPAEDTVWFAKGSPRAWLEHGQTMSVSGAPTRWGRFGFSVISHLRDNQVEASVDVPGAEFLPVVKLRLRVPEARRIRSVRVDDRPWTQFDPDEETVTLHPRSAGTLKLVVSY